MDLKKLRKQHNLTQTEMATIMQMNQQAYSRLENSTSLLTVKNALKISEHFGISLDEIYGTKLEWTEKDRALGVQIEPIYPTESQKEWLKFHDEIIKSKGEEYLETLKTLLETLVKS